MKKKEEITTAPVLGVSRMLKQIENIKTQHDIRVWLLNTQTSCLAGQLTLIKHDFSWGELHADVPYLELSLLVGPQRLPLWRVKELVAVDVMQELTLQGHIDPGMKRNSKGQKERQGLDGDNESRETAGGHFAGPLLDVGISIIISARAATVIL